LLPDDKPPPEPLYDEFGKITILAFMSLIVLGGVVVG